MANAYTITGDDITSGTPTDPAVCRVTGDLRTIFNTFLPGRPIILRHIDSPIAVGTQTLISREYQKVMADINGVLEFDVLQGATIQIEIPNRVTDFVRTVTIPEQTNIDLIDLLFPHVESLDWVPTDPIAAVVDEVFQVNLEATLSDGQVVLANAAVTLLPADTAVLLKNEGVTFTAVGAGSTTISVDDFREESLDFNEEPDGDTIVKLDVPAVTLPTPITVNVT